MKIYIAGSWHERAYLRLTASQIERETEHKITSRWWHCNEGKNPIQCALMDLQDMESSDCVLVFMQGSTNRGGRMVELGWALGRGKPVIIIGERTNVFTHLCPTFPTWNESLLP